MTRGGEIDARSLRRARIDAPEGVLRGAVLPFFTPLLDVRLLLVVPAGGELLVTRDLPRRVAGHTLEYGLAPHPEPAARALSRVTLARRLHFDPWWLLRGRRDVPLPLLQALLATNLAGRDLGTVWFDDALLAVVAARDARGRVPREAFRAAIEAAAP